MNFWGNLVVKKSYQILSNIRSHTGIHFIADTFRVSPETVKPWCLDPESETGKPSHLDRFKRFIDELRELGLYGAVNDIRYMLFPDVIAATDKDLKGTGVEYTTHAQILFTDLMKSMEDKEIDDKEREQLLNDIELLKLQIAKLEGLIK